MNNKVNPGDVFLAHNKYMYPPKDKFHLCINEKMYFLINTKPAIYSYIITPEDCSFLTHDSHINCGSIRIEPIKHFNIIKKEQLSKRALLGLIKKVECVPTLTKNQKEIVISELQQVLIDKKI